jgi:hypothetical protein
MIILSTGIQRKNIVGNKVFILNISQIFADFLL